jgi:hypothetical protein
MRQWKRSYGGACSQRALLRDRRFRWPFGSALCLEAGLLQSRWHQDDANEDQRQGFVIARPSRQPFGRSASTRRRIDARPYLGQGRGQDAAGGGPAMTAWREARRAYRPRLHFPG